MSPSTEPRLRRRRILVVDQDEVWARMLARSLRQFEVVVAFDGENGLDRAVATYPDLIIADVAMPKLDGIAMVAELKNDPALRDVPVMFLSSATDASLVAAAITAGARHFLTKPVAIDHLVYLIKRVFLFRRPKARSGTVC